MRSSLPCPEVQYQGQKQVLRGGGSRGGETLLQTIELSKHKQNSNGTIILTHLNLQAHKHWSCQVFFAELSWRWQCPEKLAADIVNWLNADLQRIYSTNELSCLRHNFFKLWMAGVQVKRFLYIKSQSICLYLCLKDSLSINFDTQASLSRFLFCSHTHVQRGDTLHD